MPSAIAQHNVQAPAKPHYLTSLDGLRAIAIVAIIVYHMETRLLPGGFLGITVFFALSGYLITSSLMRELGNTRTIDFKGFWTRRLKRLWPSMMFVVACTVVLMAIFSHPMLTKMRPDIAPALLFFSNWWYIFHNLSYFEALGAPSPLTHFWFLAIEGQFYLVWPLLLLGICKLVPGRKQLRIAILVLAAASAIAMAVLYNPYGDPSRVYYGTDTQAFSLLAGAWLGCAKTRRRARNPQGARTALAEEDRIRKLDIAGCASLVVLVIFMFVFNGYSVFLYRGGFAIVAVLSVVLLAALAEPQTRLYRAFSAKPLCYVGKRSYSLYLWHYPLLLLMNPVNSTSATPWWMYIVQLAVIFAAGEAAYRLVEEGSRMKHIESLVHALRHGNGEERLKARGSLLPQGIAAGALVAAAAICLIVVPATSGVGNVAAIQATQTAASQGSGSSTQSASTTSIQVSDTPAGPTATATGTTQTTTAPTTTAPGTGVPGEGVCDANILLIGDSVAETTIPYFGDVFPNGTIDALINRQFYEGSEHYESALAGGWSGNIVVMCLGSNGVIRGTLVDDFINEVGPGKTIYFVNIRTPEELEGMNNDLLASTAPKYSNVHVIDWYSLSAGHDDWFDGDGTHPTEAGCYAYLNMIREAIQSGSWLIV